MALSAKNRSEIVDLIGYEADFERSGISGRIVRDTTATPRQGDLNDATYGLLMRQISRGLVQYVVFSYQTPIAWVYTNGSVALPEIQYSATTSSHQKMVREAFGGLVNHNLLPEPQGDAPVVLSDNEEVILRRMRDEDGTEFDIVFKGPASEGDQQRFAPRDQVETLVLKGLAVYLVGTDAHGEWGVVLTPKGREYLDKVQPVKPRAEILASQFSELAEDDLIELASGLADRLDGIKSEMIRRDVTQELGAVVKALKIRRDATADARRRVGHYLRHVALQQDQYDRDMASGSDYAKRNAKAPAENIDSLRVDKWTKSGELLLSDLQRLVPVSTFDGSLDGKQLFMDTQADRLEQWKAHPDYAALPQKQKDLLPCIAAQHIHDGYNGFAHDSSGIRDQPECYVRIHQSTMNSLLKKKHIVGSRTVPGFGSRSTWLMLLAPKN